MAKYSLTYFGDLDTENLEDYYGVEVEFNEQKIRIDLNIDNNNIDPNYLEGIKYFLDNIVDFDRKNKEYIESDYASKNGTVVRTYVEHHLKEIEKEELSNLIDFEKESVNPEIQLMLLLQLVRVGFYPESEDQFAVFDYSIGEELTQYIVVININQNGIFTNMTVES